MLSVAWYGASTGPIGGYHDVNEIVISSFVVCNVILNLAKSCENFSLLVWLVGNKSICDLIWEGCFVFSYGFWLKRSGGLTKLQEVRSFMR